MDRPVSIWCSFVDSEFVYLANDAFAHCRRLRALVLTSAFFNHCMAEGLTGAFAPRDAHIVLTRLIAQSAYPDWENAAWDGVDFWVRADELIAHKRRGEIEGNNYLMGELEPSFTYVLSTRGLRSEYID
ncbi:hypothetical protein B0H19DRAFT_1250829 [Mycena capillaripes]|nr:hypothetical protein B0H19DRAFT_1250829 [Mycena capillaripes]